MWTAVAAAGLFALVALPTAGLANLSVNIASERASRLAGAGAFVWFVLGVGALALAIEAGAH